MSDVALQTPLTPEAVSALTAGDSVRLSGTLFTARDAAHKYLASGQPAPCDLTGAVIYHCGPVIIRQDGQYRVTAAGPTTSMREEPYMAEIIRRHHLRAVIGKGGMGPATLTALRECGCVYLHAVGGAAQVLGRAVRAIRNSYFEEQFGPPEAIWELEVADFPALVTMDAHGRSLHESVEALSAERLWDLLSNG